MRQSALGVLELLAQQRITATVTGDAVDLQNYINPGMRDMKAILLAKASPASDFTVASDAPATDVTLDVTIEESNTTVASDFTTLSTDYIPNFTQVTDGGTYQEIHFRVNKRYIRGIATIAGTTPTFELALLVLAEKRLA